MKHCYFNDGTVKGTIARDAHDQSKIYMHTEIDDKKQLDINQKIRNEGLLPSGSASKLMDGDVIAYAFSFPTIQNYEMCKRDQPDLMRQVEKGTDTERMTAARKLAILYPQYIITQHQKRIR